MTSRKLALASLSLALFAAATCKQPAPAEPPVATPTPAGPPPPRAAAVPRSKASARGLAPDRLRCENLEMPLAVATARPRLSWIDVSSVGDARNLRQAAYQIRVASSRVALLAGKVDRWDSGRVESDATYGIEYGGTPLRSREQVWWMVRVWDETGAPSEYAPIARFAMGLDSADWKAEWVGFDAERTPPAEEYPFAPARWIGFANDPDEAPAGLRLYQATFTLPPAGDPSHTIERARLLATGDDRLWISINGREVVHEKGHPERVADVDVATSLKPGDNDVRVLVRNDAAGTAGALLKLTVRTSGGAEFELVSDGAWLCAVPNFHDWATRELESASWPHARVVAPYGGAPWKTLTTPDLFLPPTVKLRRRFLVNKQVVRAVVYAAALGLVDVELNGARVSDDRFTPGWTDYKKRVYYRAFDVTDRVKPGDNVLGAELADGWYSGYVGWGHARDHYGRKTRAKLQLHVDYADGTSDAIASDRRFEATRGSRREADFLMGEWQDAFAQLRHPTPWKAATVGAEVDPPLEPHPGPPVQVYAELEPVAIREATPGAWVFDLGQNFAGVARLKVKGRAGQTITLRFAERLNPDGTLYTTNLRGARATDRFTLSGFPGKDGFETFEPRFTFHGFQYVEVIGLSEPPNPKTITGVAFSSATPLAGRFACSNPMLEKLQQNALWTQRSNFIDVPTDCPQRDERLGWMGDAQAYLRAATYQADVQAFFTKWLVDVTDAQRADGQFPQVAPLLVASGDGGPAWADAGVICPWTIWQVYGDRRQLERSYPSMKRFVDFCRARSTPELLPPKEFHGFGDWLQVDCETPNAVIYEAYFARSAALVAQAAEVLGQDSDAKRYAELRDAVKRAFVRAYVKDDGTVLGDTQCAYVLALAADLLDGEAKTRALAKLVRNIESRKGHLSTGVVGTKDLLQVLSRAGRDDVAWRLVENVDYPSWGFTIRQGATTIWERWNGWTPEKGFEDPNMNSFSHYAFGAVYHWMAATIGGIRSDAPGFAAIRIAPRPGGGVTWADVDYDSVRGPIASRWKIEGDALLVETTIPPNTTATIEVPTSDPASATSPELSAAGGAPPVERPGCAIFSVGSGTWHFRAKR